MKQTVMVSFFYNFELAKVFSYRKNWQVVSACLDKCYDIVKKLVAPSTIDPNLKNMCSSIQTYRTPLYSNGRLRAFPACIRLGSKWMSVANTVG
jgi:hypothetical protein